jgi:arsenate reductase
MDEVGISLAGARPRSLDEVGAGGWDLVVTVCDDARESCPVLPGVRLLHVAFPDPALADGSEEERLAVFRAVRDRIRDELLPHLV